MNNIFGITELDNANPIDQAKIDLLNKMYAIPLKYIFKKEETISMFDIPFLIGALEIVSELNNSLVDAKTKVEVACKLLWLKEHSEVINDKTFFTRVQCLLTMKHLQ